MTLIGPHFVPHWSIFCPYGHNGTCFCMLHLYSVHMLFSFSFVFLINFGIVLLLPCIHVAH